MKKAMLILLGLLLISAVGIGMSYGFGWINVHKTKTIGKAQQNAEREVFEETQSYVHGKRQEALKYYKEYKKAPPEDREAIKEMVSIAFSDFDEGKLSDPLKSFVHKCKYQ